MPQIIAPVVAWLGTIATSTWIAIGMFVASTAYSLLTRPDAPESPKDTGDPGLRTNTRSTQELIKVVYGLQKVGGNDVYMAMSGTANDYIWLVQTLSEGQCDSINTVDGADQVWLGDKLEAEFGSLLTYWFHDGSASQTVDTNLAAAAPEWTDTLRNTCYIVYRIQFDRNYFQSLPVRMVELKGKIVWDFRDWTWAWSDNPVLCLYDYITNGRYGCGVDSSKIDVYSWESCANYCDAQGWTLNMGINQDKAAIDVVNEILGHFRGVLIWYDGKYYLRYADLNEESSLMDLEDEHIVQDGSGKATVSISQPSQFDRPDAVRVKFIDSEKSYVVDNVIVGDETGVVKELSLLGCTDRETASNLGVYNLERWQLDRTVTGRFRGDALQLEPNDVITFTSSALDISGQAMRVREANVMPEQTIELTLAYEDEDLYNDDYDLNEDNVYTCSLPDPYAEPPPVVNASLTEETYNYRLRTFTRLKVTFNEPSDYAWFDRVEVWLSYDNTTWEHIFDSTSDFEISNVEEGQDYYIRLKTVNIWGVKQQDDNDRKLSRSVTGYIDSPDSVAALYAVVTQNGVNLYADKLADTDIELYEFRLGSAWAGGIFLAATRAPNLSLTGVKPGTHTFLINTLGNNGIYGDTARSTSATLLDPPDGWAVQATETVATLITNGTMEADSDWSDYGSPPVNARSDEQAHEGTYSRKFTTNGANDGIQGAVFTTVTSSDYGWSAWVYPSAPSSSSSSMSSSSSSESSSSMSSSSSSLSSSSLSDSSSSSSSSSLSSSSSSLSSSSSSSSSLSSSSSSRSRSSSSSSSLSSSSSSLSSSSSSLSSSSSSLSSSSSSSSSQSLSSSSSSSSYSVAIRVKIRKGDNSDWIVNEIKGGLTRDTWNFISGTYTESAGGAGAYIVFESDTVDTGTYYIDDVCLARGTFTNAAPVLYNAAAYIRGIHSGSLTGSYKSWIFDRSSSDRYMVYVLGAIATVGAGTTWGDLVPSPDTWDDLDVGRTWAEILQTGSGAQISGTLCHGDTSPPAGETIHMEILSAIVTARYYQVEIDIVDPANTIYGYHALPVTKFCQ